MMSFKLVMQHHYTIWLATIAILFLRYVACASQISPVWVSADESPVLARSSSTKGAKPKAADKLSHRFGEWQPYASGPIHGSASSLQPAIASLDSHNSKRMSDSFARKTSPVFGSWSSPIPNDDQDSSQPNHKAMNSQNYDGYEHNSIGTNFGQSDNNNNNPTTTTTTIDNQEDSDSKRNNNNKDSNDQVQFDDQHLQNMAQIIRNAFKASSSSKSKNQDTNSDNINSRRQTTDYVTDTSSYVENTTPMTPQTLTTPTATTTSANNNINDLNDDLSGDLSTKPRRSEQFPGASIESPGDSNQSNEERDRRRIESWKNFYHYYQQDPRAATNTSQNSSDTNINNNNIVDLNNINSIYHGHHQSAAAKTYQPYEIIAKPSLNNDNRRSIIELPLRDVHQTTSQHPNQVVINPSRELWNNLNGDTQVAPVRLVTPTRAGSVHLLPSMAMFTPNGGLNPEVAQQANVAELHQPSSSSSSRRRASTSLEALGGSQIQFVPAGQVHLIPTMLVQPPVSGSNWRAPSLQVNERDAKRHDGHHHESAGSGGQWTLRSKSSRDRNNKATSGDSKDKSSNSKPSAKRRLLGSLGHELSRIGFLGQSTSQQPEIQGLDIQTLESYFYQDGQQADTSSKRSRRQKPTSHHYPKQHYRSSSHPYNHFRSDSGLYNRIQNPYASSLVQLHDPSLTPVQLQNAQMLNFYSPGALALAHPASKQHHQLASLAVRQPTVGRAPSYLMDRYVHQGRGATLDGRYVDANAIDLASGLDPATLGRLKPLGHPLGSVRAASGHRMTTHVNSNVNGKSPGASFIPVVAVSVTKTSPAPRPGTNSNEDGDRDASSSDIDEYLDRKTGQIARPHSFGLNEQLVSGHPTGANFANLAKFTSHQNEIQAQQQAQNNQHTTTVKSAVFGYLPHQLLTGENALIRALATMPQANSDQQQQQHQLVLQDTQKFASPVGHQLAEPSSQHLAANDNGIAPTLGLQLQANSLLQNDIAHPFGEASQQQHQHFYSGSQSPASSVASSSPPPKLALNTDASTDQPQYEQPMAWRPPSYQQIVAHQHHLQQLMASASSGGPMHHHQGHQQQAEAMQHFALTPGGGDYLRALLMAENANRLNPLMEIARPNDHQYSESNNIANHNSQQQHHDQQADDQQPAESSKVSKHRKRSGEFFANAGQLFLNALPLLLAPTLGLMFASLPSQQSARHHVVDQLGSASVSSGGSLHHPGIPGAYINSLSPGVVQNASPSPYLFTPLPRKTTMRPSIINGAFKMQAKHVGANSNSSSSINNNNNHTSAASSSATKRPSLILITTLEPANMATVQQDDDTKNIMDQFSTNDTNGNINLMSNNTLLFVTSNDAEDQAASPTTSMPAQPAISDTDSPYEQPARIELHNLSPINRSGTMTKIKSHIHNSIVHQSQQQPQVQQQQQSQQVVAENNSSSSSSSEGADFDTHYANLSPPPTSISYNRDNKRESKLPISSLVEDLIGGKFDEIQTFRLDTTNSNSNSNLNLNSRKETRSNSISNNNNQNKTSYNITHNEPLTSTLTEDIDVDTTTKLYPVSLRRKTVSLVTSLGNKTLPDSRDVLRKNKLDNSGSSKPSPLSKITTHLASIVNDLGINVARGQTDDNNVDSNGFAIDSASKRIRRKRFHLMRTKRSSSNQLTPGWSNHDAILASHPAKMMARMPPLDRNDAESSRAKSHVITTMITTQTLGDHNGDDNGLNNSIRYHYGRAEPVVAMTGAGEADNLHERARKAFSHLGSIVLGDTLRLANTSGFDNNTQNRDQNHDDNKNNYYYQNRSREMVRDDDYYNISSNNYNEQIITGKPFRSRPIDEHSNKHEWFPSRPSASESSSNYTASSSSNGDVDGDGYDNQSFIIFDNVTLPGDDDAKSSRLSSNYSRQMRYSNQLNGEYANPLPRRSMHQAYDRHYQQPPHQTYDNPYQQHQQRYPSASTYHEYVTSTRPPVSASMGHGFRPNRTHSYHHRSQSNYSMPSSQAHEPPMRPLASPVDRFARPEVAYQFGYRHPSGSSASGEHPSRRRQTGFMRLPDDFPQQRPQQLQPSSMANDMSNDGHADPRDSMYSIGQASNYSRYETLLDHQPNSGPSYGGPSYSRHHDSYNNNNNNDGGQPMDPSSRWSHLNSKNSYGYGQSSNPSGYQSQPVDIPQLQPLPQPQPQTIIQQQQHHPQAQPQPQPQQYSYNINTNPNNNYRPHDSSMYEPTRFAVMPSRPPDDYSIRPSHNFQQQASIGAFNGMASTYQSPAAAILGHPNALSMPFGVNSSVNMLGSTSNQDQGSVSDYLKQVQFSDSDRDKLMASYLTCDGLLNDNDHCLERLSCEFSDPQNIEKANKLDRAVSSILLGHILINTYIPNQFKLRLKSASLYGFTNSGKCSRYTCSKLMKQTSMESS